MRKQASWALASLGICLVAILMAAAPGENPVAAWEYKFVVTEYDPPNLQASDGPNSLGAEGWELVSATADSKNKYVLYFKRPKQPTP